MRRLITLLAVALSLLLVTAVVPAAAKKPPRKPPPEPAALYEVTLQITGEDGLGMCDGSEPQSLTMLELADSGALVADGRNGTTMPRLHLKAAIPWTRDYPPDSGDAFDGCHGGPLLGSDIDVPSYFMLHGDGDGNVVGVLWAFDVYNQKGTKGKNKTPGIPKEFFRLWSSNGVTFTDAASEPGEPEPCHRPLLPSTAVTCDASGPFQVWHYYPIEQIGETNFEFTVTITKQP